MYDDTYLAHFGIKGQKWGVRRFQNEDRSLTQAGKERYRVRTTSKSTKYQKEDGSLTDAGRKKVAQSGLYLQPDVHRAVKKIGRIPNKEKQKVREENLKEYWKHHDELYDSPHALSEKYHEMWDSFKNKYASATLKDLKFKDNKKARAEVKAILKSIDPDYDSRADLDWEDRKPFEERRNQLLHPMKEKIKRGTKKAKSIIDTAASVKKLVV